MLELLETSTFSGLFLDLIITVTESFRKTWNMTFNEQNLLANTGKPYNKLLPVLDYRGEHYTSEVGLQHVYNLFSH